jgi:hypothetical protein
LTGIAVKSEAGEPLTSVQTRLNGFTTEHVAEPLRYVAKGCGIDCQWKSISRQFVFQYILGKCEVHYEKSNSCIEEFSNLLPNNTNIKQEVEGK